MKPVFRPWNDVGLDPPLTSTGLPAGTRGQEPKRSFPAARRLRSVFRLVPNQSPEAIDKAFREAVAKLALPGAKVEVKGMHGAPGLLVPLDSPYVAASSKALEHAFGKAPVMTREGGSIPVVATLHEQLNADALLLGWGQDDDNTHSPNERFLLADFYRGIRASAKLWEEIGKI